MDPLKLAIIWANQIVIHGPSHISYHLGNQIVIPGPSQIGYYLGNRW